MELTLVSSHKNDDITTVPSFSSKRYKTMVKYDSKIMHYDFVGTFDLWTDEIFIKFQRDIKTQFDLQQDIKIYDDEQIEIEDIDDLQCAFEFNANYDDINFILNLYVKFQLNNMSLNNLNFNQNKSNNTYFDLNHEESLKNKMLDVIFNFNKYSNSWNCTSDLKSNIISHYKYYTKSSYFMRAAMLFDYNNVNIMDYYEYLKCGYNDHDLSWVNNKSINKIIKIFDDNHQLMYNKGNGGLLNYFISPRDSCYIRTRFKYTNYKHFKNTCNVYDITGSLHYSVDKNHEFYVKENKDCVRATMFLRGFILCENKLSKKTVLYYLAHWDINGNIPKFISEMGMKNIANNYTKHFYDTWLDKVSLNIQRRYT